MLQIKNITKDYVVSSDLVVHALKNVSVNFRQSEFVSILGPSGCGKTTLLNIIGGWTGTLRATLSSMGSALVATAIPTGMPIATTASGLYSKATTSSLT